MRKAVLFPDRARIPARSGLWPNETTISAICRDRLAGVFSDNPALCWPSALYLIIRTRSIEWCADSPVRSASIAGTRRTIHGNAPVADARDVTQFQNSDTRINPLAPRSR